MSPRPLEMWRPYEGKYSRVACYKLPDLMEDGIICFFCEAKQYRPIAGTDVSECMLLSGDSVYSGSSPTFRREYHLQE